MKLATKRSSTTVTLLVALALLLAACSGGDDEEAEVDEEDLAAITAMVPFLETQAPATDGRIHQAVEEFTGKTLDITWVPNADFR